MKFTMLSDGDFRQINIYTNTGSNHPNSLAIHQTILEPDGHGTINSIIAERGQARRLAPALRGVAALLPVVRSRPRHIDPTEGGDPIDVRCLSDELIEISQLTPGRLERIQLRPDEIDPFIKLLQLAASIEQ